MTQHAAQIVDDDPTTVNTKSGLVEGVITNRIRMFRSIPFGSPPIGNLRWQPPQPIPNWGNDTLYATHDPPGCVQSCSLPPHTCPLTISEDCLYLNIFTPLNITNESPLVPVLLFIHGGSFDMGYGGGILYNGTDMANLTNTILVTINYRLGTLGNLWSIEAGMEGNYGFMDQKLAMQWVHDNIGYFGGDNNQVTLFGQSAGAVSVALHLMQTSVDDSKLFQHAIMESEPIGTPLRDTTTWGLLPKSFFKKAGCDYDLFFDKNPGEFWKCLRNRTIDQILDAQNQCEVELLVEFNHVLDLFMPWTPTVGTSILTEQPIRAFQRGHYRDIPFMIGTVMNEGRLFTYEAFPNPITREEIMPIIAVLVGPDNALQIREEYPMPKNVTDYRDYASQIVTDGMFKCATRNATAQHLTDDVGFTSDVFLYHFDHSSSFNEESWGDIPYCYEPYVCHAEELPYVFHINLAPDNTSYTDDENDLALAMQSYWTQFAKTGKPSDGGHTNPLNMQWSPFILGNEPSIEFQVKDVVMQSKVDLTNSKCAFWDSLNYDWIK